MTMFDSGHYDIPTLIEKLHDQRFDGYDAGSLANEVEKFRDGSGTASMGNAVEALKSVVTTLAGTDATLRKQLAELGVTWQSQGGDQAGAMLAEQAGFAGLAYDNVSQAAQLIFDQGEAFNRTKNKLPDPDTLRQSEGGYSFMDTMFSLFGFETDHASAVKAGTEARAQAVDALNAYAHDSGDYLASAQAVPEPQVLNTTPPPAPTLSGPGAGLPESTAQVPDVGPTAAAGMKDAVPAPHRAPPPAAVAEPPPASAGGFAAPPPGATQTTPRQSTSPSPFSPSEPETGPTWVTPGRGGAFDDTDPPRTGRGGTNTETGPGLGTAPDPGRAGGAAGGKPGDGAGGPWGNSDRGSGAMSGGVPAGGVPGGPDGRDAVLGKAKMVGATPIAPSANTQPGPGFTATRPPAGVDGADSVTAIGAGGVGAVTSGDDERHGPGTGRNTAAERGKAVRPLDVGDLPEGKETHHVNRSTPQVPSRERTRAILEPAATQDGGEDAEHVRRYGIDDRDLFTDQREVSPDLIGDRPMPEDR